MNKVSKKFLDGYVGLSLAALIVVAVPVFFGGYAIHNDYYASLYHGCCFPETDFLFLIGRPLGAILLNVEFAFLGGLEALRWARIFGVVLLFLIFLFTYRKFVSIQPERRFLACLAALLIVILPGFLLNTIWVADHVPGLVGTLTSIWAYYLCDSGSVNDKRRKAFGYLALFLAFLIYPPSAYYFLVFTVWKALFGNQPIRAIVSENLVLVVMSLAYLIYAKYINLPLSALLSPDNAVRAMAASNYSLGLAHDLPEKANTLISLGQITFGLWGADIFDRFWRFVIITIFLAILYKRLWQDPTATGSTTATALALILVIGNASVPVFNAAVVLVLCLIPLTLLFRSAGAQNCWFGLAILASLVISIAPIVASQTGFAVYRNTTSATAIVAVIFVWALANLARQRTFLAIALCSILVGGFLGHERLEWTALNAIAEYDFLKKKVDEYEPGDGTIMIKQPAYGSLIYPFYVYRDFGLLTTNVNPIAGGLINSLLSNKAAAQSRLQRILDSSPISGIHKLIYPWPDYSGGRGAEKLPIVWVYRDINGFEMDNHANYVIDMSLAGFMANRPDDSHGHAVITVKPTTPVPPIYAFSDDKHLFWNSNQFYWQTSPGFPIDLQVRFDSCRQIAGYELVPWVNDFNYMPKKWVATFSNPDSTAILVSSDHEALVIAGKVKYPLDKVGCYSLVNFHFLEGFSPDNTLRIGKIRFYE
jgi:hypothetical protein